MIRKASLFSVNRNRVRIYFGALCIWLEAGSSTTAARCGASFTAGERGYASRLHVTSNGSRFVPVPAHAARTGDRCCRRNFAPHA
jgi:hypothetical protein